MVVDASVFGGSSLPLPEAGGEFCAAGPEHVLDRDGVIVPLFWHPNVARWEKQPLHLRQKWSRTYLDELAVKANKPVKVRRRTSATNYSTAYAKDLCRERHWKVIQSEYRDHRGNLRDTPFGSDVVAMRGNVLIYIQAGCDGSRAEHYRRFRERTEVLPMGATFLYWEFLRSGELSLEEDWTHASEPAPAKKTRKTSATKGDPSDPFA